MSTFSRRLLLGGAGIAALTTVAAACGTSDATTPDSSPAASGSDGGEGVFPVTIQHAYGETVIERKPERVATVAWGNHDVPLALGVVPVGMAKAAYGDDDNDGILPWVKQKLDELGGESPVLFDESDALDFEGVANTTPDVILAAYSGLSQADYDTLSKIAPTVAFPEVAWGTGWRECITMNATALGLRAEGEALVTRLEGQIADEVAKHPQLQGKNAMMVYVDPKDLSQISVYTTLDSRVQYLTDLGLATPAVVTEKSEGSKEFFFSQSAEQVDVFNDVDIVVGYGDDSLVQALQQDKLISTVPAVKRGSLATYADGSPVAASATPSALSIPWALPDYVAELAQAADRV